MRGVDLNSDLGEGSATDGAIMPFITSANVACGAHAGDRETMLRTIDLALRSGVAVGAHPGYRDPAHFGRVALEMSADVLADDLREQLSAIADAARAVGAKLAHVKAHGALYNSAVRDEALASTIVETVRAFDADLVLFAPPDSAMDRLARRVGLRVAREGFADRAYEADGALRSRQLAHALHTDPEKAAAQALRLAREGKVSAFDGTDLALDVDTICLHGDTPNAAEIARVVRRALDDADIEVRAFG